MKMTIAIAVLMLCPVARGQGTDAGTLPIPSAGQECHDFAVGNQGQTQTDTWTWGGGIVKTVTTSRHDNEPVDAWNKRHKEAVMSALQYFPPDHPQHNFLDRSGIYGDTMYARWHWTDVPGGTSHCHLLEVARQPGQSRADWQAIFRQDLVAQLHDFPKS